MQECCTWTQLPRSILYPSVWFYRHKDLSVLPWVVYILPRQYRLAGLQTTCSDVFVTQAVLCCPVLAVVCAHMTPCFAVLLYLL